MARMRGRAFGRTICLVSAGIVTGLVMPGCASQVSGLAPVSGAGMYAVSTAAKDVLVAQGVDILVAPTCVQAASITCMGTTVSGQQIVVSAPGKGTTTLTITIGGTTVYTGSIRDVLDRAAQG